MMDDILIDQLMNLPLSLGSYVSLIVNIHCEPTGELLNADKNVFSVSLLGQKLPVISFKLLGKVSIDISESSVIIILFKLLTMNHSYQNPVN